MLWRSSFSLNGFLTKEQFAHPRSSHFLHLQKRQSKWKELLLLDGVSLLLIWSPVDPAHSLPLFGGFQSTKEDSLGSPSWPRPHERGCESILQRAHCQAVPASFGELPKRCVAFEENLPEEIAYFRNLYAFLIKLGKAAHPQQWMENEEENCCVPRNSGFQRRIFSTAKWSPSLLDHSWLYQLQRAAQLPCGMYFMVKRWLWFNPSTD